ncbi:MAG: hypothetical protein OXP37_00660 [Chloroflexota bacterium]|nr:hypothetical protein [Chloroflexota bacterium]
MIEPSGLDEAQDLDDESAIRLLRPDWVDGKNISSLAFQTGREGGPRHVPVSLFVKDRLPNRDGQVLHLEKFTRFGRTRLAINLIRSVTRDSGTRCGFDVVLTGSADPPLEEFGSAHALLIGPVHKYKDTKALARAFTNMGVLEKLPD